MRQGYVELPHGHLGRVDIMGLESMLPKGQRGKSRANKTDPETGGEAGSEAGGETGGETGEETGGETGPETEQEPEQ